MLSRGVLSSPLRSQLGSLGGGGVLGGGGSVLGSVLAEGAALPNLSAIVRGGLSASGAGLSTLGGGLSTLGGGLSTSAPLSLSGMHTKNAQLPGGGAVLGGGSTGVELQGVLPFPGQGVLNMNLQGGGGVKLQGGGGVKLQGGSVGLPVSANRASRVSFNPPAAATLPAATLPAATLPAATLPAATLPAATLPAATLPAATHVHVTASPVVNRSPGADP